MKIFFLLIFFQTFAYSQTFEATYQFEINKEYYKNYIQKSVSEGKNPALLKKAFSRYLNSRPAKAKLIFNSEMSYYYVVQDMGIDQNKRKIDPTIIFAGNNTKIYNTQDQDSIITHINSEHLDINEFLVKEDTKPVTLKNKTQTIGQYQCYLAEMQYSKKQSLKLWYAPDIPTNFNIKDYKSLPGLLIKIESQLFKADLVSLKQVDATELKQPPSDITLITKKEYQDMVDKTNPFKD